MFQLQGSFAKEKLYNIDFGINWADQLDVSPAKNGGVRKAVLKEGIVYGPSPVYGDFVWVHYIGSLANGTKFDSSHDRGAMFTFQLGYGQVIKAYELAIPTTKKGELALFRSEPEYAYGEQGTGDKIPGNAVLLFQVEVVDFKTCEDKSTECSSRRTNGECITNYEWMQNNCFRSCSACKPPECFRSKDNCDHWAMAGECETNPGFMLTTCADACKNCQLGYPISVRPLIDETKYDMTTEDVIVCSKNHLRITCPANYKIYLDSVAYGRADPTMCTGDSSVEGVCLGTGSDAIVKKICEGGNQCEVLVSSDLLGDHCEGYEAYLTVSYRCKPNMYEGFGCDGSTLELSCPNKTDAIFIMSAFYGRQDKVTCGYEKNYNTSCKDDRIGDNLSMVCNGQNTCSMVPWDKLFGDEQVCPDTKKYMHVKYMCMGCSNVHGDDNACDMWAREGKQWGNQCTENPVWMMARCSKACVGCRYAGVCEDDAEKAKQCKYWASIGECWKNPDFMLYKCPMTCNSCYTVAKIDNDASLRKEPMEQIFCEGHGIDLTCKDPSTSLYIIDFFYGRTSTEICPHPTGNSTTTCYPSDDALDKARDVCNGRSGCHLYASSEIWGDSCEHVHKYAKVNYACQGCGNVYDNHQCETMSHMGRCDTDHNWMYKYCFKACTGCGEGKQQVLIKD